jgi:hypothetical protein
MSVQPSSHRQHAMRPGDDYDVDMAERCEKRNPTSQGGLGFPIMDAGAEPRLSYGVVKQKAPRRPARRLIFAT